MRPEAHLHGAPLRLEAQAEIGVAHAAAHFLRLAAAGLAAPLVAELLAQHVTEAELDADVAVAAVLARLSYRAKNVHAVRAGREAAEPLRHEPVLGVVARVAGFVLQVDGKFVGVLEEEGPVGHERRDGPGDLGTGAARATAGKEVEQCRGVLAVGDGAHGSVDVVEGDGVRYRRMDEREVI